ncbi:unnamed protein product [Adineta steineri]|uniref:Uncharacterized protein n=3 Tax=Adineta steineri TaxID=433720 RepID=A0A818JQX5_9BILA|nr:unnamed protein product [Adineta steineri]
MVHLFSLAVITLAFIYTIESAVFKTPVACSPVKCPGGKPKTCPYGYQKSKDGCDICKCNDPCNPQGKAKLCGPKERCHVEKKADGTFGTRCDAAKPKKGGKGDKKGGDKSKVDCTAPAVTGMCRAAHKRFHYNSATKACQEFTYGGCGGSSTEKFITGKITHVDSNHIDKNSKIEVTLRDTSLMDTAAKLIATTTISDATTFPVSYKLKYNPSEIKDGHTYSVSARINGPDHQLHFINDVNTRVNFADSSSPMVDIAVIRVGGSASSTKASDQKVCAPVKCSGTTKTCPYGYQKLDGCEICKCNDPCNPPGKPILCGSKQRCFVDKKPDGSFGTRCDTVSSKRDKHREKIAKIFCSQPRKPGPCKAHLPRFYYNSVTKSCLSFVYGGCQGNKNNFPTKADCEKACRA